MQNLEFARELQKQFTTLAQEVISLKSPGRVCRGFFVPVFGDSGTYSLFLVCLFVWKNALALVITFEWMVNGLSHFIHVCLFFVTIPFFLDHFFFVLGVWPSGGVRVSQIHVFIVAVWAL